MINFVKEARIQKQLTQQRVAELINVSRQTIISIETNRYVPSVLLSLKLARTLGMKVEELFALENMD